MTYISPASGRSKALRRHRALWRAATIITMLAIVASSAWLGREPLLRGVPLLQENLGWLGCDPIDREPGFSLHPRPFWVRFRLHGRFHPYHLMLGYRALRR
jgi:hypothetical protein